MKSEAAKRAMRGAKFLDKKRRGWWRKIRLSDLDMRSGRYTEKGDCGCVLAQLYGGYFIGVAALDLQDDMYIKQRDLGLDADFAAGSTYEDLDEAWRDEIRARRKAAA